VKRVLLIEDLPQVAEHLKGMLGREKDIEVAGVQGQAEAGITQATTEKPDVVLIDALLQGKVTGFDVAKRIRAASPGTRIVIITVPQRPVDPRPELGIDAVFPAERTSSRRRSVDRRTPGARARATSSRSIRPRAGPGRPPSR